MEHTEVVRLRRAVSKLARRLNGPATNANIPPAQASVLALVATRGTIPRADVAALEHVGDTVLDEAISALREAGLLIEPADPPAVLQVTPAGQAVEALIRAERTDIVARAAAHLTDEDRAHLDAAVAALERLATAATG